MKTIANFQENTKQNFKTENDDCKVKNRIEFDDSKKATRKKRDAKKKPIRNLSERGTAIQPKKIHETRIAYIKNMLQEQQITINHVSQELASWVSSEKINRFAEKNNFNKKSNAKILPVPFVHTMVHGLLGNGGCTYKTLAIDMQTRLDETITPQAIFSRLSNVSTVQFLNEILQEAMQNQLNVAAFNPYAHLFPQFSRVRLEDSTQIELSDTLSKEMPGAGGSSSSSSMKLNITYDITRKSIDYINIACGSCSDNALGRKMKEHMSPGELWIRDLGYFCLNDMKAIIASKSFFISRLKKDTKVFLSLEDKNSIDIYQFLKEKVNNKQNLDQWVYVGLSKIPMRLVAEKVPKHVQKKRLARLKKNRHKKCQGKEISEDCIIWAGYSVFVTNVAKEVFSAKCIIIVYKIRWQIELFFKRSKSISGIDKIKQKNTNRLKCIVYIKLIALLVSEALISYLASLVECEREISETTTHEYLKSSNRLGTAIVNGSLKNLITDLILAIYLLSKEKRKKRKSTFQQVREALLEMRE